jgi:hypothetical protein
MQAFSKALEMNRRHNGGIGTVGVYNTSSYSYNLKSLTFTNTSKTLLKRWKDTYHCNIPWSVLASTWLRSCLSDQSQTTRDYRVWSDKTRSPLSLCNPCEHRVMFMSYSISCNAKLVLQLAQVRGFAVSQPREVLRGFVQPPTPCNLSLAHFMSMSKFQRV